MILQKQGKTKEEALIEVIEQLSAENTAMDIKIAACIKYLNKKQIKEIFKV